MSKETNVNVGAKGKAGIAIGVASAVVLILSNTFNLEGGFVDHPNDPGGATNHGITERVARGHGFQGNMRDLKRWCPQQLRAQIEGGNAKPLPVNEICADGILFKDYIQKPRFIELVEVSVAVAEEVIDTSVNMGPRRPSRFFQRALNSVCGTKLKVDGRVGDITIKAWKDCHDNLGPRSCVSMLRNLDKQQENEYDRPVRRNPRLRVFRRGWQNHRIGNVKPARCYDKITQLQK